MKIATLMVRLEI